MQQQSAASAQQARRKSMLVAGLGAAAVASCVTVAILSSHPSTPVAPPQPAVSVSPPQSTVAPPPPAAVAVSPPQQALAVPPPRPAVALALPQPADAVSLPDMALGRMGAPVTIVEYSSMTCTHCASFQQNVFPILKSKYIDTGNVRFVLRELPLDTKAAAGSMVARCIAKDDAGKYFGAVDRLFKQQDQLVAQPLDTLKLVGAQSGLSEQAVETCLKDQSLVDKLNADSKLATDVAKVTAAPTFVINGEMSSGEMSFEHMDARIRLLLQK